MIEGADRKQISPQFAARKPKSIVLSQEGIAGTSLVKTEPLQAESLLPLVARPIIDGLDSPEWARTNREFIETELYRHGAILFRNFSIPAATDFERFAQSICGDLYGEYGDLPREEFGDKVYGSTVYPPEQTILFHNESSHMNRWPLKIFFYCAIAAKHGGETPLLDCRKVYQLLDPKIRDRFERKRLMYARTFVEGLDVPWRHFFRTNDRSVVEELCRRNSTQYEWVGTSGLRLRQICPAVSRHPKTGESIFFNQIQLHHVSCLDPAVRESLCSIFKEEDLPRNVYYGDGSRIEDDVMAEIGEIYRTTAVTFSWQQGDVVLLDNMLTAHSRNPFVGPRKILVALGQIQSLN